jgi:hypothetical protein
MNIKKFIIILLITLSINLSAQNVHFQNTDGTKTSYNLNDIRKVTMENNKVQVHMKDGNIYERNMAALQNYRFDENQNTSIIDNVINEGNQLQLVVFPNPTDKMLHLTYTLKNADDIKCTILDLQGKVVKEINIGKQSIGEQKQSISLENLAGGNYTVQIQGQNFSIYKKIVKQ